MSLTILFSVLDDAFFAAVAALGFAMISNPPRQAMPLIALLAALGHGLRFYLMTYMGFGITTASVITALIVGVGSMALAKVCRIPAEFFSFPALLPMIPGMYAYKTVLSLMQFMDTADTARMSTLLIDIYKNGLTTFFVMLALVIGALLPLYIFHKQSFVARQWQSWHTPKR